MGYTGFRVSEILDDLSNLPVQYQADSDPRVDFKFQYPDLNSEAAKSEAIRSLVDYVKGRTDTLDAATDGYLLTPAPTFGQRPSVSPGTKLRIEGQSVQADKLSIGELAEVLREQRSETFYIDQDTCCTTVSFDRDASLAALQQQLVEVSGVFARPVNRMVATLRVSDR